jgi:hypothetical protein
VCYTVLAADVTRRRRVRVHTRVRAGTSPSRRCAPQHARALVRKARLGLWPLFLRRPSMLRSCRCTTMASPWVFASRTRSQKGALSSWSASAHLATGRRFHTHSFVPDCGFLVRRHPWRRPELRHGLRRTAYLRPTLGLSPSRSPLRMCAPKRTPAHASLRASSPEKAPDHLPRTAAAPTPPCPHRRQPWSVGHLLS